jgi:ferredoxin-fold anticodon binding domain-containing protein
MKEELKKFIGQTVVLDTRSSWVYVGVIEKVTEETVVLKRVDVHDVKDAGANKELYIHETRSSGIKENREMVYINLDYLVSFSMLKDVKKF